MEETVNYRKDVVTENVTHTPKIFSLRKYNTVGTIEYPDKVTEHGQNYIVNNITIESMFEVHQWSGWQITALFQRRGNQMVATKLAT